MARKARKGGSSRRNTGGARSGAYRKSAVRSGNRSRSRSQPARRSYARSEPRTLRIVVETAPQAGVGQLPLTAEALANAQVQTGKKGKAKF